MIHYESKPIIIGNHSWRLVIYDHEMYNGKITRCTDYQWQDNGGNWWPSKEWPTYNDHDGTYAGLPRTLRKLWEREKDVIDNIIYGKQPEAERQYGLL